MEIRSAPGEGTTVALLTSSSAVKAASMPVRPYSSADDHNLFREGLRTMLDKRRGVEVVGEAKDGLSTVQLAASSRPMSS